MQKINNKNIYKLVLKEKQLLSIIVPAYRQEQTIRKDLININQVLSESLQDCDYEIICVIDGDIDGTLKEARKVKLPKVKILGYQKNKGKGYAVRYGISQAQGNLISFLDAGMEISPASMMMLMSHLKWYSADIIVGSKRHPVSRVNYPILRHIYSVGYHLAVRILFGLPLSDTQSGIKIFRREVVNKVLPRLLVKRFAMDIEFLAVARYLGFKRIYEAPIEVAFDKKTTTISWPTIFKMLWDTLAVFYRLKVLRYYDDKNSKNWQTDIDNES